jgi:hypothetical protein
MGFLTSLITRGRTESATGFMGTKWLHYATFLGFGVSVLYFTLELDKAFSRKAGKVLHR